MTHQQRVSRFRSCVIMGPSFLEGGPIMYRCCPSVCLSVCPSVRPSVPCLLLFRYRFRYVSLNSYGKRNSHSKDREIAGMYSTARTAPQRAAPQRPHPLVECAVGKSRQRPPLAIVLMEDILSTCSNKNVM